MSVPPPRLASERLFTPGARLGWIFRDLRTIAAPYPEPEPDAGQWHRRAAARAEAAQARYDRARRWTVRPCLAAMLLFLLLAGFARGSHDPDDAWVALLAAAAVGGSGLGYTAGCWFQNRRDQATAARPEQDYDQAHEQWRERAAEHRSGELERLGRLARLGRESEWGSAQSPTRRTDVFGGSLRGWQALLTTHGASILAAQPLLVMDLSGQLASGQLTATARQAGVPAAHYVLPADLDRCGLLSKLTPAELTGALAEAIHADAPGGARSDRAVDARVLQQLTSALDGRVTPARLAAAAQSALGHPVLPGLLSAREEALIGGDLFAADHRRQIGPNLIRLDAFLAELARYAGHSPGAAGDARPAYYTCLALEAGARSAHGEMLAALAIQWLTVQVSASPASAPAAIIAGADEITRPHLERLSDACERRGVPLTLMFRHLRDDSLQLLGGGTAAFMRLGNHAEAEQAASYIGRRHTFVLSQRTVTLGTNDSVTRTDTDGRGVSDSGTVAFGAGWPGNPLDLGQRSRGVSTSRNWSTGMSWADGTSWSDSAGTQRVYEYAVEPAVLQGLPDRALLLAVRGTDRAAGPLLRAVECDPGIVTLPGVSTRPLAALPMPRRPGGASVMSAAATTRRHQPR